MRGLAAGAGRVGLSHLMISHICSLFCLARSLRGGVEVSIDERGHVVLVGVATLAASVLFFNQVLQESILLRAHLLEDVGQHILHILRLGLAHHGEKVLADRKLHCTSEEGVSAAPARHLP